MMYSVENRGAVGVRHLSDNNFVNSSVRRPLGYNVNIESK